MDDSDYGSRLHQYLEGWATDNDTSLTKILEDAGRSASTGTDIRKGGVPRPKYICDIADVIGVPRLTLLVIADYLCAEEIGVDALNPMDARFLSRFHQIPDDRHELLFRVMGGMTEPAIRPDELRQVADDPTECLSEEPK